MTVGLRITCVVVLLLECAGASLAAGGTLYDLRVAYQEGDMARYQVTATGGIRAQVPEIGQIDMPYSMGVVFSQIVTKVSPKGNFVVNSRYEKMVIHMMGQKTETPVDQLPEIQMLISPNGKVLDTRGLEAMSAASKGGAGGAGFGSMAGSIGQGYAAFPDKPVPVGYAWSSDLGPALAVFGSAAANARIKHRLAAIEKVDGEMCARIDSTAHVPIAFNAQQMGLQEGGDMKFVADLELSAWYPVAACRLARLEGRLVLSGSGDVTAPDGSTQRIEFEMDMNINVDEVAHIGAAG